MKKKGILLAAVILLSAVGFAQAKKGELHGTIDMTYLSSYIWRGFDVYPEGHSTIQTSIDVDLFGTGFGVKALMNRAIRSGFEKFERWDYALYYRNILFGDEPYATQYMVSWVYYNYPDADKKKFDLQEVNAGFSWPKIFGIEGLVPSYVIVKLWPSSSDSFVGAGSRFGGTASGWAHIFMLDYGLNLADLSPDLPEQVLRLHSEFVYNDGVGPGGQNVDHDWSNAVFGLSTDFEVAKNLIFTPGIYYQASFDDSVNDDDETWVSLSMKYKF